MSISSHQIFNADKGVYVTAEIYAHFGHHGPLINKVSKSKVEAGASSLDCTGCGTSLWVHGKLTDHDTPEVFTCPFCNSRTFNTKKYEVAQGKVSNPT